MLMAVMQPRLIELEFCLIEFEFLLVIYWRMDYELFLMSNAKLN